MKRNKKCAPFRQEISISATMEDSCIAKRRVRNTKEMDEFTASLKRKLF